MGIRAEFQKSDELDRQLEEVGKKKENTTQEIEARIEAWKAQKKVLGVKDSDAEVRIQSLFAMLDTNHIRRRQYINDMEMFKKRLDDTKAVSTSNVVRIREIEDIIVQRDSSLPILTKCFSRKKAR